MAKKALALDGLLDTSSKPINTGIPQREPQSQLSSKLPKREGEKRLTLALDGATYKRLRLHAVEIDKTHQAILEIAISEYLDRVNAK